MRRSASPVRRTPAAPYPRDRTPSGSYVEQTDFYFVGDHAPTMRILERRTKTAMMEAHALARRLAFHTRSINLTAAALSQPPGPSPPPGHPPIPFTFDPSLVDQTVLQKVQAWADRAQYTIQVDQDTREYAYVATLHPRKINIRADLVSAAGKALKRADRQAAIYKAHIFHLAVIIGHELQHCLRLTLNDIPNDTPPTVNDGYHLRRSLRGGTERIEEHEGIRHVGREGGSMQVFGEGGWAWEMSVIGGELQALVDPDQKKGSKHRVKIEKLIIQVRGGTDPHWFKVLPSTVQRIMEGAPGWEQSLPILPGLDNRRHTGISKHFKLRDMGSDAQRDPTHPTPFPFATGPADPLSSWEDLFPGRTCGYRGAAAHDQELFEAENG